MKNIKITFNNITLFMLLMALLSGYIKNALMILFIVLFHEFGHIFIALILGFKIESIEIFPFGGITKIDKLLNTNIYKDILISIFGVLFQMIIFILGRFSFITNEIFLKYNTAIMFFNMLPIIPLDGSKFLFEIYNLFIPYKKAINLYLITSIVFILIYIFINFHYALNNYLIISLFIYKTIEIFKNRKVIHHKFILERLLYDDISFSKIKNVNESINSYQKDIKYYYDIRGKKISEKEYLRNIYFNN